MGKEERFVRIYSQRTALRSTGTLVGTAERAGMLDKDGKPVVSSPDEIKALKK